ncbi:MAG TPA: carboxypeptidase-like regulatory domain-containing protein [Bacteroidales bacterium]|nr:carboxypeptidase-like regulatory domain-containing protein [Bacteroidales bacterium]
MKKVMFLAAAMMLLSSCQKKETSQVIYSSVSNISKITGRITTLTGDTVLAGVKVTLEGTFHTAYTDSTGHYFIPDVAPGYYTVVASKNGYQSDSATVSCVDWRTVQLDLSIAYIPVPPTYTLTGTWSGWMNPDSAFWPMGLKLNQIGTDSIIGVLTYRTPGIPPYFPPDSIPIDSHLTIQNNTFALQLWTHGTCNGHLSGTFLDPNTITGELFSQCINEAPLQCSFSAQRTEK